MNERRQYKKQDEMLPSLSRRENQIMDIVYERGRATAADVLESIVDPPSYSSIRALLRIIEEKGHLRHVEEDGRYVFLPIQPRSRAAKLAISHVIKTFFGGSAERAVATLLSDRELDITEEQLDRLAAMIDEARKKNGGEQ